MAATARREELEPPASAQRPARRAARAGALDRDRTRAAHRGGDGGARRAARRARAGGGGRGPPLRRDRGQPALRGRGAARGLAAGPGRAGVAEPEGAGRDPGAPRAVVRAGPRPGRRRGDDRARVHGGRARRGRARPTRRPSSRGLDELWQRRIVREQGADAYDFSHDTIREVAYLALSPARRRQHHLRVARALERVARPRSGAGERATRRPLRPRRGGRPGGHLVRARGRGGAAAAREHARRSACWIARSTLLRALPDRRRSARRGNSRSSPRSPPPSWRSRAIQSNRLTAVQRRALELAQALGIEPAPPLLRSLAIASLSRDDFAGARRFAEQLRARGERDADDVLLVEGGYVLGVAAFWRGEFDVARGHFESAVARYRPEHRRAHLLRYGQDPEVSACSASPARSGSSAIPRRRSGRAMRASRWPRRSGIPTRMIALVFAALLALEMREPERLRGFRGVARRRGGERRDLALPEHRRDLQATSRYSMAGPRLASRTSSARSTIRPWRTRAGARAHPQRVLLEACAVAGEARTGLAAAERMLAMGEAPVCGRRRPAGCARNSSRHLVAPEQEVEAEFGQALQVARRQGARSPELRAAMSLLRHRLRPATTGVRAGARPAGHPPRWLQRRTGYPRPAPGRRAPRPRLTAPFRPRNAPERPRNASPPILQSKTVAASPDGRGRIFQLPLWRYCDV